LILLFLWSIFYIYIVWITSFVLLTTFGEGENVSNEVLYSVGGFNVEANQSLFFSGLA
jgi:hypothetical protein